MNAQPAPLYNLTRVGLFTNLFSMSNDTTYNYTLFFVLNFSLLMVTNLASVFHPKLSALMQKDRPRPDYLAAENGNYIPLLINTLFQSAMTTFLFAVIMTVSGQR